jgi:hypothetical protein
MQSGPSKHNLCASRKSDSITSTIIRSSVSSLGDGMAIDCCSDFVLSGTPFVVENACISQPRDDGRDMVIKPEHSVNILNSVSFCCLDIVFLCQKKVVLSTCLSLRFAATF